MDAHRVNAAASRLGQGVVVRTSRVFDDSISEGGKGREAQGWDRETHTCTCTVAVDRVCAARGGLENSVLARSSGGQPRDERTAVEGEHRPRPRRIIHQQHLSSAGDSERPGARPASLPPCSVGTVGGLVCAGYVRGRCTSSNYPLGSGDAGGPTCRLRPPHFLVAQSPGTGVGWIFVRPLLCSARCGTATTGVEPAPPPPCALSTCALPLPAQTQRAIDRAPPRLPERGPRGLQCDRLATAVAPAEPSLGSRRHATHNQPLALNCTSSSSTRTGRRSTACPPQPPHLY